MTPNHDALADTLSMTEIIRLQDALSKALVRRFEKRLALVFSDLVDSTGYFARFGDEAGRKLQQRHLDLVDRAVTPAGGRVVDTAGDGIFLCFPDVDRALHALVELQQQVAVDNDIRSHDERLAVRVGCHFGPVLTDDVQVSGDSVNLCSRVAGSCSPGEIRLTSDAYHRLTDVRLRIQCRALAPTILKGIEHPIELLTLDWRDPHLFPTTVRFGDGTEKPLPPLDLIRFGRLQEKDGVVANDVLLHVPGDPLETNRISRWQFELHRRSGGFMLRSVSDALTEVDGKAIARGDEAPVRRGTRVGVAGVLELEFLGNSGSGVGEATLLPG